ncbi:MAG: hypothetical protein EOM77_01670 [Bacteroidia bacterium]|nr:hypothetical protein [Bacteroidia bacterium]
MYRFFKTCPESKNINIEYKGFAFKYEDEFNFSLSKHDAYKMNINISDHASDISHNSLYVLSLDIDSPKKRYYWILIRMGFIVEKKTEINEYLSHRVEKRYETASVLDDTGKYVGSINTEHDVNVEETNYYSSLIGYEFFRIFQSESDAEKFLENFIIRYDKLLRKYLRFHSYSSNLIMKLFTVSKNYAQNCIGHLLRLLAIVYIIFCIFFAFDKSMAFIHEHVIILFVAPLSVLIIFLIIYALLGSAFFGSKHILQKWKSFEYLPKQLESQIIEQDIKMSNFKNFSKDTFRVFLIFFFGAFVGTIPQLIVLLLDIQQPLFYFFFPVLIPITSSFLFFLFRTKSNGNAKYFFMAISSLVFYFSFSIILNYNYVIPNIEDMPADSIQYLIIIGSLIQFGFVLNPVSIFSLCVGMVISFFAIKKMPTD